MDTGSSDLAFWLTNLFSSQTHEKQQERARKQRKSIIQDCILDFVFYVYTISRD